MYPTISVIIPVKNEKNKIRKCVEGILAQSIKILEIVVIDSGSTDGTLEILSEFPIVRIIEIPSNEFNHGTTRNLGIAAAKGDYVLLTVGDAEAYNDCWIKELLGGFVDKDVVAVCGAQIVSHETKNNPMDWFMPISNPILSRVQYNEKSSFRELSPIEKYGVCHLDNVTAMYRRETLLNLPFKKITYGEDMLWTKEALELGFAIVYNYKAKVCHYHIESSEYTFKLTFTKCYFAYTQFQFVFSLTKTTILQRIKILRHLFLRIGFKPSEILKWYFYNKSITNERFRAIELFNSNIKYGYDHLEIVHSKYCGKPPIPVK